MSNQFYAEMPAFANFQELTNFGNYIDVPEDWVVIITDVRGSTKAIEAGRYKDVNTIGAATIVSLNNAMGGLEYPFVFGGDGATAVIPRSKLEEATKELTGLCRISEKNFNLTLRVGMVGIDEIVTAGSKVQVAKYALPSGVTLAVFQGGGLNLAEDKIKKEEEKYSIILDSDLDTDLMDLSCRWKPLESEKGQILSLLVSANQGDPVQIYGDFLREITEIVGSLQDANPATHETLKFNGSSESFREDLRYQLGFWASLKRFLRAIKIYLGMNSGIASLLKEAKDYVVKIPTHSDFHKFDEMVRMVIDVTPEQIDKIRALCEKMHVEKKIHYGIHLSNHAIMTCVVPSFDDGAHIHFIDGGDGGYAMAAKQLKGQLKSG